MLPNIQSRDCLIKLKVGIEIRVLVVGAVPTPKTGVHRELGEISEPRLFG